MSEPKTLTELHEKLAAEDEVLIKQAEEEDAAGRIMARGFADELNKIAQGGDLDKMLAKAEAAPPPKTPAAKPAKPPAIGPSAGGRGPTFTPRATAAPKPAPLPKTGKVGGGAGINPITGANKPGGVGAGPK